MDAVLAFKSPLTSRVAEGVVVWIPTLPFLAIVNGSVPLLWLCTTDGLSKTIHTTANVARVSPIVIVLELIFRVRGRFAL